LAKPRVRGVYILPPGQSEDPASPHYSDQLQLAGWWMFTPMELMTAEEAAKASPARARESPSPRAGSSLMVHSLPIPRSLARVGR